MMKIRFGKSEKGGAYEEMKRLSQTNREYMHQFELIQSRLQVELPYLPESHYITPFVSGLREDIKHLVLAKHPTDLLDAFEQAKHMEIALDYYAKKKKFATKPQNINTLNGV